MKYRKFISSLLAVLTLTATIASGQIISETAEADGNSLARRMPLTPMSQDHMCSVIPHPQFELNSDDAADIPVSDENTDAKTDIAVETQSHETDVPDTTAPETTAPESAAPDPHQPSDSFPDYVTFVPESDPVDDSYFKDALFIGDSRTVSLMLYSGVKSYYYAVQGLTISGVMNKAFIEDKENGEDVTRTVIGTIERYPDTFKKVYICLGVNELGWNYSSTFISVYEQVINKIKALLPEADIYIQAIVPVSAAVSEENEFGTNNARIFEYNTLLSQLSLKCGVNFLALDECFADQNYTLPDGYAFDGIHFNVDSVKQQMDYLRTHTISAASGGNN